MLSLETLPVEIEQIAKGLPPFPSVVLQLLDMLLDEDASLDVLIRHARNDPVITSGILATANQLRRMHAQPDLYDPFVAASIIGTTQVKRIVVTAAMNKFMAEDPGAAFLFNHSRAVAIVAQELATLCGVSAEKAYVAGILHDVGQLCFHVMDADKFQSVYRKSATDGRLTQWESEAFGVDHTQIGSALAKYWKLPEEFISSIRDHHDAEGVTSKLQAVINVAESLARALDIPSSPKNRVTQLNEKAIEELGIDWGTPKMLDCFGRCRARYQSVVQ
jgi:putative nucleotidyltransferase with HDIG domain